MQAGTTVSAPGRIICAGDHAQLIERSTPIVSCAIEARLRVHVTSRDDHCFEIRSSGMHRKVAFDEIFTEQMGSTLAVNNGDRRVVTTQVIRRVFEDILEERPKTGLTVTLDADEELSLGTGLSSSTAFVVALAAGISTHLSQPLSPTTIATRVAEIESDLYSDARPSDAHAIARGGCICESDRIEHKPFYPDLTVGIKRTELDYGESVERAENYWKRSPRTKAAAEEFAFESAQELREAVRDKDETRFEHLLVAAGDGLEALGLSNAPLRSIRAKAIAHSEWVGVKQSGIGHRAVLIGHSTTDTSPLHHAMRSVGGKVFDTTVAKSGIKYDEEIGSDPSIPGIEWIGGSATQKGASEA